MCEPKICNKCGCESYVGKWKFGKWFCSTCLEYCNVSDADDWGTKEEGYRR